MVAGIGAVLILAGVASIAASARTTAASDACALISKSQLESILGLHNVVIQKDIVGSPSADNVLGDIHDACIGLAWSGAPPASRLAALAALKNGTGGAFTIETWAPDNTSKYVQRWNTKGYDAIKSVYSRISQLFPGIPALAPYHFHSLRPAKPGRPALGATAMPQGVQGVIAAGGIWWNDTTASLILVAFEESAAKPAVSQLNHIARITGTKFGLNPHPLG